MKEQYKVYTEILRTELIPALGCTEPIAIAFAAAKARETLGSFPDNMKISCSGNVIKNAMGVVIPGTGNLKGIAASAILGALIGESSKELEVLSSVDEDSVEKAKQIIAQEIVRTDILDTDQQLHIIVEANKDNDCVVVELKGSHTNIVKIKKNEEVLFLAEGLNLEKTNDLRDSLDLEGIFDYINNVPLEEINDILKLQISYNTSIAKEGLSKDYGVGVGVTLLNNNNKDDIKTYARSLAAGGSDARMSGCTMPVVINSGSGNQGLTVSLPVIAYADYLGVGEEKTLRALALSNLVAILQKREIGRLSAFCGVVCAACGSGTAITYLYGGDINAISRTIINTLASISGMVCDGAKGSCAAKISSAVDAAILGHELSMRGNSFASGEGIIKEDADKTIQSIGRMARIGMKETDKEILKIMIDM